MQANPFEKIGLSLSGGGYRAAVFHLGTMAYLEECRFGGGTLLDRVGAISTVSGGTITGVVWALKKQQGASFQELYDFLLGKLERLDLVAEGLQKLRPEGVWQNPHKTKNLINAFAELYDREFTHGATFEELTKPSAGGPDSFVFNATEFSHGVNFRFQNKGRFGNNYFPISKSIASEIKLSDVIAASSCFPGGFEPMAFPHDFRHTHSPQLEQLSQEARYQPPLGLMDGGINDNQGIDSLLKRISPETYSLLIVSDVASSHMNPFVRQEAKASNWFRRLSYEGALRKYRSVTEKILGGLLVWSLLGLALAAAGGFSGNFMSGFGTAMLLTGLLLMGGYGLLKKQLEGGASRLWRYLTGLIPLFYRQRLAKLPLKQLSLGRFEPLLLDRIFSLSTLLNSVFLKTLRREAYAKVYGNRVYRGRSITTMIHCLTEEDFNRRGRRHQELPQCPPELRGSYMQVVGQGTAALVKEVASFGTTLWFTEQDQLNDTLGKLVKTGKISMCYNLLLFLLEYIYKPGSSFSQLEEPLQREILQLYDHCLQDWRRFKAAA